MLKDDLYAQTVEAIYARGVASERMFGALEATGRLPGGHGTTLQVIDKATQKHIEFASAGLPSVARDKCCAQHAAINPRIPPTLRQRAGEVGWDCKFFDERVLSRDPFSAEFLPEPGLRYFVSAVIEQAPDKFAVVAVQRSRRRGHASDREISLMQRRCPHFQRAYDMRIPLKAVPDRENALENALDLLADGIALLRRDASIVYVNEALRNLAAHGHDFRIDRNAVEFASPDLRSRFAAALSAVTQVGDPSATTDPIDFAVPRDQGLPAYTVSVRPLMRTRTVAGTDAVAMLLVHDPLQQNFAACRILQELFGLTKAEAHLVHAIGTGMTAIAYARSRGVSITTVYTHLRRTREKTGWKSVAELTRRFGELNVALRAN
jgi:DNA-binding CsgD family transcriptional regulator/PAS domain-containing protein